MSSPVEIVYVFRGLMSSLDKYDEASGNYTQTVSIEGQVVSTLSTASGKAQGWGTAVECQDECSGIVNAHSKSMQLVCHYLGLLLMAT